MPSPLLDGGGTLIEVSLGQRSTAGGKNGTVSQINTVVQLTHTTAHSRRWTVTHTHKCILPPLSLSVSLCLCLCLSFLLAPSITLGDTARRNTQIDVHLAWCRECHEQRERERESNRYRRETYSWRGAGGVINFSVCLMIPSSDSDSSPTAPFFVFFFFVAIPLGTW